MAFTVEKVLSDARLLVNRLKDHDNVADTVIAQNQALLKRMEAMKQYQDDLSELNEAARHRPRANLIMGLLQENNQIRELQAENRELRNSLEEHQSAIELIMSKYREQVAKLMLANKLDQGALEQSTHSKLRSEEEMETKIDKICEMAVVMQKAIRLDEEKSADEDKLVVQLKFENQTLRELLKIGRESGSLKDLTKVEQETQTVDDLSDVETTEDECNRSVIYRGPDLNLTSDEETKDDVTPPQTEAGDVCAGSSDTSQNDGDVCANSSDTSQNDGDVCANSSDTSQNDGDVCANSSDTSQNDGDVCANSSDTSQNDSLDDSRDTDTDDSVIECPIAT